jgi:hypothetical protein
VTRAHVAGRPHWRCRACGAPYPCGPARLDLLAEYAHDRIALALYLAGVMHEAMDDTWRVGYRPDILTMHQRFLGWIPRGGHPAPDR